MRYLAKIMSLPKVSTGEMTVTIPSVSEDEKRTAHPAKQFMGLYEPYKLGDIVIVENIEGMWYYGDRPYAVGEYKMDVPKDSYSYVTPFGYIAFTKDNVTIKHVRGGELIIDTNKLEISTVSVSGATHISSDSYLKVVSGEPMEKPTKWR